MRLNPHLSLLLYRVAANIRPGCAKLCGPPRRLSEYDCGARHEWYQSQALPGRPLWRLATTSDEKCGPSATFHNKMMFADVACVAGSALRVAGGVLEERNRP